MFGLFGKFLGCGQQLGGGRAGFGCGLADSVDVLRHLLAAPCGLIHVSADLLGRGGLLLHGRGNGSRDLVDLGDGLANPMQRRDRAIGLLLHRSDLGGNFIRRICGLGGQVLDLAGHDRKAFTGLACSCSFNRRVECQQIGLIGDVIDQINHVTNFLGRIIMDIRRKTMGGLAGSRAG